MTSKHKTTSKKASDESIVNTRFENWEITVHKNIAISKPILIEGMPGIGNVGKISMDVLIEEMKADLLMSFFSYDLPNSVFVNEENLIDLPKIELYYKRINGQDYLMLTGDIQPGSETASYEFCELVLDIFQSFKGNYIITLGGIGLNDIPETPKVYITGNDKSFLSDFKKSMDTKKIKYESKIYGLVGPILGISGLLLGLSKRRNIKACSLLAETFGHPVYVGLKGARSILAIINSYYSLAFKFEKLEKEIRQIDAQLKGLDVASDEDFESVSKYKKYGDINYIG